MHFSHLEISCRRIIYAVIVAIVLAYVGQGVVVRLRLAQIGASLVDTRFLGEACNHGVCIGRWSFVPEQRLLLLGNVLRTHTVRKLGTPDSILPVSNVRGTVADSWTRLRVYRVDPGETYIIEAEKPQATRMDYFVGILPRTTDHEGVLSIPDISPTISSIVAFVALGLLVLLLSAASLGQSTHSASRGATRHMLDIVIFSAGLATVAMFISLGVLDTLLLEGDLRNKILRFSSVAAIVLPVLGVVPWAQVGRRRLKLFSAFLGIVLVSNLAWPWLRGGPVWALTFAVFLFVFANALFRRGYVLPAALVAISAIDPARILGLFQYTDYPPIYLVNVTLMAAFSIVAADLGGISTIAMAGTAYRRFRRDLVLKEIQTTLSGADRVDSAERARMISETLPQVAALTGAGRVSVTISLPLGRPFTQVHDAATGQTQLFDDGKIMGAATLRTMVYGDEALFESYADFAARLRLPANPSLSDASYFCALPLRVNRAIIGTVMLTRFNDEFIAKQIKARGESDQLVDMRETVRLVGDCLSRGLSTIIVQDLNVNTAKSKELQSVIQRCIGSSSGAEDFLWRYAAALGSVLGIQVMVHEQREFRGQAVAHYGVPPAQWNLFVEAPFNLSPQAAPAYGPSVVAFREGKSSYLKDVREIFDRLHPRSCEIFSAMNTGPTAVVPMQTTVTRFVVTALRERTQAPFDPGLVPVIEATEALFVAALEVMNQKTSVMALGQLASRLIGDEEVRNKILDAAKSPDLPTTVGTSRTSFLLLFDLAGSSNLSEDTDAKARAYGDFYDSVNRKVHEALGGLVRKTIGDAVIVTWDGTDVKLQDHPDLLNALGDVTVFADEVARGIGCKGARALLHHGSYFLGLVGTSTFGQIDVIGRGIDEVCKAESFMKTLRVGGVLVKLAISADACERLPGLDHEAFMRNGFADVSDRKDGSLSLSFAKVIGHQGSTEVRRVS